MGKLSCSNDKRLKVIDSGTAAFPHKVDAALLSPILNTSMKGSSNTLRND